MPLFEIDGGNGKTFEVDAPSMSAAASAFKSYSPGTNSAPPPTSGAGALTVDNLVRSAAQGIPVVGGAMDKFAAGMDALTNPILGRGASGGTLADRYQKNAAAEAAKTSAFEAAHPLASTAANIAGGTAALAPLAATGTGAKMLGFGGGPLLGNMARGAASGAAIGTADATVRGDDPLSGASWGGGFGALGPVAGRAIGGIANRAAKPAASAESIALQKVADPLKAEGLTTPEAVKARLDEIGPEAMLADANPNLTQMGGAIAASPGAGQQIMRDGMGARTQLAGPRITDELDQMMGKPVNLDQLSKDIHAQGKSEAGPLFKDAYSVPIQSTPELDAVLSSPFGKIAVNKAKQLALSDTTAPGSAMFRGSPAAASPQVITPKLPDWANAVLAKGGAPAEALRAGLEKAGVGSPSASAPLTKNIASSVDVRGLHLTRQSFDDMIEAAKRAGSDNKVRILSANRSAIDSVLKSVDPMKRADAIYADMSKIRRALGDGLEIFRNNQTPEHISSKLGGMSSAEREAYLQGGRVAVRNVMGTARNDAAAARGMFAKEFNQEKLKLVAGDGGAASVLKRIGAEQVYANSANRVMSNSETASRALGKAELEHAHGLPSYHDVAVFSGTHGIIRRAIGGMMQSAYNAITSGRQKAIEASIARLLTAQGVDRAAAIEAVMSAAIKADPSGKTNRLIAQTVARLPRPADDQSSPKSRRPAA